jgi:small subunit ribosomal protein S8
MTDTVADMIIRMKNGYLAHLPSVVVPASKLHEAIARILVETGYIASYERVEKAPQAELVLTLRYVGKFAALTDVERVSKPGRRMYATAATLPRVLAKYGTAVISTSTGLLTTQQAKAKNLGGEILFKIW